MPVTQLMVTSDHPVPVEPQGGSAVVQNVAGSTLYYADFQQVSSSNNLGTIAAGGSQTFLRQAWIVSAGLSTVTVTVSATSTSGATVTVNEGPLQFTDPRVGGVLDDGTTDNGFATPGFVDGLSAFNRATALLRTFGPGGELHFGSGTGQAIAASSRPLTIPNNCTISGETADHGNSKTPAYDGSSPPFRYGVVIKAVNSSSQTFNGGTNGCLVQLGENLDTATGVTATTKRNSGNTGAVMRNLTVFGGNAALPNSVVYVAGARATIDTSAIHMGGVQALNWAGQGGMLHAGWVGNNNVGAAIVHGAQDLHIVGGVRVANALTALSSIAGGLYVTGANHWFLGDSGAGPPANSKLFVLKATVASTFVIIGGGNIIENSALEQIAIKPASGGSYSGITIVGNLFYGSLWTADTNSSIVIDGTTAGAGTIRGVNITGNTADYGGRQAAFVNCITATDIASWSVTNNLVIGSQHLFAAGSLLPDGAIHGNIVNTANAGYGTTTVRKSDNEGTFTWTADGTAVALIPHTLSTNTAQVPRYVQVTAGNAAAATAGVLYTTIDDTNISVHLNVAPAASTSVVFNWKAAL